MTTYFTDAFGGSDGAAWNTTNWTNAGTATSGATATIQGNKGRLNAGTVTGYAGRKAMRTTTTYADFELEIRFTYANSGDGRLYVGMRSDADFDGGTYYEFYCDKYGTMALQKVVSGSVTSLGSASFTVVQGTVYGLKFYAVGTSIKVKIWDTGGSEPGSYTFSVTDSSISAAGYAAVKVIGGGAAGFIVDFDDAAGTNGVGNQFTYTGAVTSSAVLKFPLVTKAFASVVTSSGLLTKVKVVTKLITSAITSAGVSLRRPIKRPSGSVTPTGAVYKLAPKGFAGAVTSAGVFRKSFVRKYVGAISAAGSLTTSWLGRVFGRPGIVRMTVRAAGWVGVRVRRG